MPEYARRSLIIYNKLRNSDDIRWIRSPKFIVFEVNRRSNENQPNSLKACFKKTVCWSWNSLSKNGNLPNLGVGEKNFGIFIVSSFFPRHFTSGCLCIQSDVEAVLFISLHSSFCEAHLKKVELKSLGLKSLWPRHESFAWQCTRDLRRSVRNSASDTCPTREKLSTKKYFCQKKNDSGRIE